MLITDDDWSAVLPAVQQLPTVRAIIFESEVDNRITRNTLDTLGQFSGLKRLDIRGATEITDNDLSTLSNIQSLQMLVLDDTEITGEGLGALETLPQLEHLYLDGTPLTEEGLQAIAKLKRLKSLSLSNTGLPESAVDELEAKLPGVMISDD